MTPPLPITARHRQGLFLPRTYVVYRTSEPITVDGNLDKKAWWDAPWTEPFEDHQAPNAPAPWRGTRAAILWDDEYLYFAARLQEENVWGSITERDAVIYKDNDFEIFLDVDERGDNYYEFEINALNTVWDMFHPREYHRGSCLDTAYDIDGIRLALAGDPGARRHRGGDPTRPRAVVSREFLPGAISARHQWSELCQGRGIAVRGLDLEFDQLRRSAHPRGMGPRLFQ